VNSARWPAGLLALLLALSPAAASQRLSEIRHGGRIGQIKLERVNRRLHGYLVDYTHNHGADRRIWSPALCAKRDLYVYLPPGYDPQLRYPLVFVLHGFGQDEEFFIDDDLVYRLDAAMACGKLPPMIVAVPDGSISGHACLVSPGSFFVNIPAGRFEDFLMQDVWNFVHCQYPIRPERCAHAMVGVSMGGGAAYNKGIKYRDRIGIVVGIFPPLNTRWIDCHGRYMSNFDPACWGWRTDFSQRHQVVGRFYGIFTVRLHHLTDPLYGRRNPNILELVSSENVIEMLETWDVRPGQLEMFLAYGGRDQFNIDAQVESFLYVARRRGLCLTVAYDPKGKHDAATAEEFLPCVFNWLRPRMEPYSPR